MRSIENYRSMSPLALFFSIMHNLEKRHTHLARGSMLSSPAIEYKGRAFAICCHDRMIVKIHDPEVFSGRGIHATPDYHPFNSGIVLKSWREVPYYYHSDWADLAELALDALREEIG